MDVDPEDSLAMSACAELEWSADSIDGAPLGRLEPGDSDWFAGNNAQLDCEGQGISITNSTWDIAAEDDDGELSIDNETTAGLVTYALITATANQTQRIYRIINTITTSGGRSLKRDYNLSVIPTRTPWR